jgi:phosphatidylglycerol:prolipoprotein diacylglycerol transferase
MFPEPVILFGAKLYWFGLFAALAVLAGILATGFEFKKDNISLETLPDLAFAVVLSGFVGARLLYVLFHWGHYQSNFFDIFKFWEGGLIQYGGLAGGLTGGFLFCRREKLSFWKLSDCVALGLAAAFAISRLGCLAAGCCFGKPTSLSWGIVFTHPLSLARPLGVPIHPTQIYSLLIEGSIYFILLWIKRRKVFDGQVLLSYFIMAAVSRVVIDFFRAEVSMQVSLFIICFLAGSLILYGQRQRKIREN